MKNMKEFYMNIYHICKEKYQQEIDILKKNKMIVLLKILRI